MPLSECEFQLSQILDELQPDAFPTVADNRPNRCTGAAMQVAVGLLGAGAAGAAGRCLLFVGACVLSVTVVHPPPHTHSCASERGECVCVCVCAREKRSMCVCVCVCERARVRDISWRRRHAPASRTSVGRLNRVLAPL